MSAGKVVVYGGRGALGNEIVNHFKKNNFFVVSIDMGASEVADVNVIVEKDQDWKTQEKSILDGLASVDKVDAVLCVAGGWAGGNAAADDMIANADMMWRQSVWSSTIAARIAAKHLKDGGLIQLTGAAPALEGTPGMIGYGMAKAAVQQLTKSLASEGSGLPKGSTSLAILPVTLDTPMNRKWMPKADHSKWTPLSWVAESLLKWTTDASSRPASGSLLKFDTVEGKTTFTLH